MTEPREYRQERYRARPGSCEILLVRHGESMPARDDRPFDLVDGHGDPPLDPVGVAQAMRVADRLASEKLAAIYVTTLQRTVQTAAPLVARLGLEPRVEPDMREVRLGEWEGGALRKHFREGHPLAIQAQRERRWDCIPGAETTAELITRVRAAITRIAAAHVDEAVAVFAHGASISQVLALAAPTDDGWAFMSDNASISHLVIEPERWAIRTFNDTSHLHPGFTTEPEPLI